MVQLKKCALFLLGIFVVIDVSLGDQYYEQADDAGDDGGYDAGDDGGGDDDDAAATYAGDDYIKYWTEYAVLAKKCITYNNVDMIVYSMYEQAYQHCMDKPVGTYMTPVPTYVGAYVDQLDANAADNGVDDYVSPESSFINCYPYETNGGIVSIVSQFTFLKSRLDSSHAFIYVADNTYALCP